MEAVVHPPRSEQGAVLTRLPVRQRLAEASSSAARPSRWATTLTFVGADVLAAGAVVAAAYAVNAWLAAAAIDVLVLAGAMGALTAGNICAGLYTPVRMHPVQELHRVGLVSVLVFGTFFSALAVSGALAPAGFAALAGMGAFATFAFALSRVLVRVLVAQSTWWGVPTVVIGQNHAAQRVVASLRRWPEIGLKPVACVVNTLGSSLDHAPEVLSHYERPYVVVALPGAHEDEVRELVRRCNAQAQHVMVLTGADSSSHVWMTPQPFEGLRGYGVRSAARHPVQRALKRVLDVVGALAIMLLLAPLFGFLALLVKSDSAGPIFYRQVRLGRGGRCIEVFKFRSMYVDADERLGEILDSSAELREEYEVYRKLSDDPRVTAVGHLLRRYSLDELPQLWNVLRGDMSLIGPRAYTPNELVAMRGIDRVILQNKPGVSGLWQVSGRNALSFEERLHMDVHYVQNWTAWLDLYILARTLPVVLRGEGAC